MIATIEQEKLKDFINAHPPARCHGMFDGKLIVSTEVDDGSRVTIEEETIPATRAAVRAWLGY